MIPNEAPMSFDDPIVREVRRAGEELARTAGFDLHRLCERLREAEAQDSEPVVSRRSPKQPRPHAE